MKQNIDERLQKAAEEYIELPDSCLEYSDDGWEDKTDCNYVEKAFKAGAQWKDKQLMAKAITAHCFGFQGDALFSFRMPADKYLVGSKVKVIVIKED